MRVGTCVARKLPAVMQTSGDIDSGWHCAGAGTLLSPREAAAVRARLEYKLLLQEGITVLQAYEGHLQRSVTVPGQLY
jgi:hypothetical protein